MKYRFGVIALGVAFAVSPMAYAAEGGSSVDSQSKPPTQETTTHIKPAEKETGAKAAPKKKKSSNKSQSGKSGKSSKSGKSGKSGKSNR